MRQEVGGHRVGALEAQVLQQLWRAAGPLSARDLAAGLPGPPRAHTTVLTILSRLRDKGLVERVPDGRSHRYRAAGDADELTAAAMRRLLAAAHDPRAVLAHLVDGLDDPALRGELAELAGRQGWGDPGEPA